MPEKLPEPPKKTWKERTIALVIVVAVTVIVTLAVKGFFYA